MSSARFFTSEGTHLEVVIYPSRGSLATTALSVRPVLRPDACHVAELRARRAKVVPDESGKADSRGQRLYRFDRTSRLPLSRKLLRGSQLRAIAARKLVVRGSRMKKCIPTHACSDSSHDRRQKFRLPFQCKIRRLVCPDARR